METTRNMYIPNHTVQAETWHAGKKHKKEVNRILESIIRLILLTPYTTPRECLYMQTGPISVEYMAEENRITYMDIMTRQKETIQRTISNNNNGKGWKKTTEETMS